MRSMELAKSMEVKVPHFQKDVIIPQIYDLQNIKLIQSCYQEESPTNKVALLKKKNIEKVIHSIVYKKTPSVPKNQTPLWKSRGPPQLKQSTLSSNLSHAKLIEGLTKQDLFVEVDPEVGETVIANEQNFAPFAERVKNILARVNYQSVNQQRIQREREVEEFILGIGGNPQKRLNPERFKKMEGMVQSIHQIKARGNSPRTKRAASAGPLRNSAPQSARPSTRLLSGVSRSCNNLRKVAKLQGQVQMAKDIIKKINDCLQEQQVKKKSSLGRIKSMGEEWGEKGVLQKTMASIGDQKWNKSTLEILRQRRLKSYALERIDNQLFQT